MKTEFVDFLRQHIGKDMAPFTVGLSKWLDGRLESVSLEGQVRISYEVREEMLNPLGLLHGGAIAAILDESMGLQLYVLSDEGQHVAIGLNVDFINKATAGQRITATPLVTRIGRSVAHATCELHNEDGKLLAKASSNFARFG